MQVAKLTPEKRVVVDLDGKIVEGRLKTLVDIGIHFCFYRNQPDVFGIAQTQSPYATDFAARGRRSLAILTPIAPMIGSVTPYSRHVSGTSGGGVARRDRTVLQLVQKEPRSGGDKDSQ